MHLCLNMVACEQAPSAQFIQICAGLVVHLLVIAGIIPYLWVNGGRTESLEAARQISTQSIIMTVVNIFIALIASRIIPLKLNRFWGIVLSVL